MNEHLDLERTVAEHIASEGATPPSEAFYDDLFSRAATKGPWPEWLALIKEPPMRISSSLAVGSPTARVAAIMVATLLLALMVAGAGIAGSRLLAADGTIVVDQSGNGDFTTISDAVAAAVDGDEILVKPGIYDGSIVIDKDITLLGEDRDSVVIEFGMGCLIDEVSEELSCPDGTPMLSREFVAWGIFEQPFGIHLDHTAAEIGSLSVHDHKDVYTWPSSSWGIFARGGAPVIHDVRLTTAVEDGFGGYVVALDGSAATIRDSELGGVDAEDLSSVTLTGSVISEVGINTSHAGSTGGESVIRDNVIGWLSFGGPVTVEGNEFPESLASAEDGPIGIFVERGGGWVIRDNVIEGHSYGIQALSDGVIEDNTIVGNDIGFQYTGDPPTMSGNRICDSVVANVRGMQTDVTPDASANEICPDA